MTLFLYVFISLGEVIFPITSPDTNRLLNAQRRPLTTQANPQGDSAEFMSIFCAADN